jgi:hypothetical protein
MFTEPKSFVVIDLRGPGGDIFAIIGRCERLARAAGKPETRDQFVPARGELDAQLCRCGRDGRDVVRRDYRRTESQRYRRKESLRE